jgi:hypothetical protein
LLFPFPLSPCRFNANRSEGPAAEELSLILVLNPAAPPSTHLRSMAGSARIATDTEKCKPFLLSHLLIGVKDSETAPFNAKR